MSYFIIQQDPRVPGQPTVLDCPADMDPEDWISGKLLAAPRNPLQLKMSARSGKFRGAIIRGTLTLFHDRFRDELLKLGIDNIQFFPVELENPEGEIETKYSLINIVGMIDAVDVANSVIEPREVGGRGWLKSFKIDAAAARGQRIFRIPHAPTLMIVDETLHASLTPLKLPGTWMLPTESYEGFN
ncbi:MAG TPA: DUF1629 domain-containing protein [Steroidobacteraceae bacterium]|nr:DUF1629 domain-containing protein [Steroidobacteraceae bacterium]